ncbi:MAG: hypothetical protein D6695_11165 [Planctomycetota bacterium]|nr:MAG: hypothetical protein D6695_11165 [Planctomycetota bacterium]
MLAIALLSAVVTAAPLSGHGPVLENQVIFITPELYTPLQDTDHPRLTDQGVVVGQIPSKMATRSEQRRAELGAGDEAPEWIIVRFRDGLFAIDPFVKLPDPTTDTARQLFKAMKYETGAPIATLGTDRSLITRKRIDATEDLFAALEHERIAWLKRNGYLMSVRTVSGSAPSAQTSAPPQRMPEDRPRTRPIEQVRAPSAGVLVIAGDQPVRISMPDRGIPASVRQRVTRRDGVLNHSGEHTSRVAKAERVRDEDSAEQ